MREHLSRYWKHYVVVIVMVVGIGWGVTNNVVPNPIVSPTPSSSSSPVPSGSGCDESLWNHVYHNYRLTVLQDCITVTGTVDFIRKEADGDDHVGLKLDPGQDSLLLQGNIDAENGDLVLESVCTNPITQADAVSSCVGFHQDFNFQVGQHLQVTGAYVKDTVHQPYHSEIHPITSVSIQ